MISKIVSLIPAEELKHCDPWLLPTVTSPTIVTAKIPRSKKEIALEKLRKKQNAHQHKGEKKAGSPDNRDANAGVGLSTNESVTTESVTCEPMTAEKLESITAEAEKAGFESGYEKGFEKGVKEGEEKGTEEGLKTGEKTVSEQAARLQKIAETLANPLEKEREKLEMQIIDMVCHLTQSVTRKALTLDSSIITDTVKKALSLLHNPENKIAIALNSQDIELIQTTLNADDMTIQYVVDDELIPGGCRVTHENGCIDASIEHRLKTVLDEVLHQRTDETLHHRSSDTEDSEHEPTTATSENNDEDTSQALENPVDEPHPEPG